jgi:hypothetical protein
MRIHYRDGRRPSDRQHRTTASHECHFVFTEDIETALGCEKKTDNAQHLLSVTANLDLPSLPAEHEIAKLLVVLKGFCAP